MIRVIRGASLAVHPGWANMVYSLYVQIRWEKMTIIFMKISINLPVRLGCVCIWMYVTGHGCYLAHLCVCCKTPYMKYSRSSENWSADLKSVSLPPSDQIPVELPRRRILISHISEMTKFRACTTAAAQRWSSDQWNTVGDTTDHTHILIRPSDWITHGCLDHYHGFHANWWR